MDWQVLGYLQRRIQANTIEIHRDIRNIVPY